MHHDQVGIERLPESVLLLCLIADYCFSRTLSALLLTYYKADTSRLNNASLLICAFFPFISQRQSVLSAGSEVNNGGTASRESERRTQKVH